MATDLSVYVELSSLSNWSSQISSFNTSAKTSLESFFSTVGDLDSVWSGVSASSFLRETQSFVNKAKSSHDQMADVEQFLLDVITTMENQ